MGRFCWCSLTRVWDSHCPPSLPLPLLALPPSSCRTYVCVFPSIHLMFPTDHTLLLGLYHISRSWPRQTRSRPSGGGRASQPPPFRRQRAVAVTASMLPPPLLSKARSAPQVVVYWWYLESGVELPTAAPAATATGGGADEGGGKPVMVVPAVLPEAETAVRAFRQAPQLPGSCLL